MPYLVVIIGPIASGKSTVAEELGGQFRQAGRAVAVLDLDDAHRVDFRHDDDVIARGRRRACRRAVARATLSVPSTDGGP